MTSPTSSTTSELNEATLAALATRGRRMADAVNAYTHSLMYLRFTGMPARGLLRRIMPAVVMAPVEEMEARGWPYDPALVFVDTDGSAHACHLYDDGDLYYEVTERRLCRADFERRLAARSVRRWEWQSHARVLRQLTGDARRRPPPTGTPTRGQKDAYFDGLMARLLGQVRSLATATDAVVES